MRQKALLIFLRAYKKLPLSKLLGRTSGAVWDKTESHLFDYNTSIITLSSSTLILSFSLIKIADLQINKTALGWSWFFFVLTIFFGIALLYVKFIRRLADGIMKNEEDKGVYKKDSSAKELPEQFYLVSIILMYFFALFELFSFFLAYLILIIAAYQTI